MNLHQNVQFRVKGLRELITHKKVCYKCHSTVGCTPEASKDIKRVDHTHTKEVVINLCWLCSRWSMPLHRVMQKMMSRMWTFHATVLVVTV